MIAVDTSVWIDFFRDVPTRQVDALVELLRSGEVYIVDLVLTEMLQGCRNDREFSDILRITASFPQIVACDTAAAIEAARNYRRLRALGITVRKTIDTLIATRCILDDVPLLYSDRDFDPFVAHLGLRSALDLPGVN